MKQPKPQPVPVNVVCSICGEPWHSHSADANGDVSTLECVRLLKAALARRPAITITQPYPVYPWSGPYWYTSQTYTGRVVTAPNTVTGSYATPKVVASASAA